MSDGGRTDFLDRAAIALVAAGMTPEGACLVAHRLFVARNVQDANLDAADRQRNTDRAAEARKAMEATGREIAAKLEIGDVVHAYFQPEAQDAIRAALAERGLAVCEWLGPQARVVNAVELAEIEAADAVESERREEERRHARDAETKKARAKALARFAERLAKVRAEKAEASR
jgi:hypothetical protein